jgi:predicted nucleotidyltransferase
MSRTIRVSDHVYERIEGVKERHDHLTMDGALREMISDYTVQEETAERKRAFTDFAQAVYDDLDGAIHAIILYGSTARGEANSTSDVDVFVVISEGEGENESEYRDVIMKHAFEIGAIEHGVGIMPYIMTHERYEERKNSSFVSTVLEEGRVFSPESFPTEEVDA